MDALEFINIIEPEHGRASCNDNDIQNGFYSYYGTLNPNEWQGRCVRCMYLEIIKGDKPEKFNPEQL